MLFWNPSYGAERRIAWGMNVGGRGATATRVFGVEEYPRAMADARYTDACGPLQQPPAMQMTCSTLQLDTQHTVTR